MVRTVTALARSLPGVACRPVRAPDSTIAMRLIARGCVRLIARVNSQSVHRFLRRIRRRSGHADDVGWNASNSIPPVASQDGQPIARQRLSRGDVAQIDREIGEAGETAGFTVQMAKVKAPTAALPAAVLAHQAIEPALDAAGQLKSYSSEATWNARDFGRHRLSERIRARTVNYWQHLPSTTPQCAPAG